MQPLVRFAPRLLFDSIALSTAPKTARIFHRPSIRISACIQCRVQQQARRYADDSKHPNTPSSTTSPQNTTPTPIPEDVPPEELPSTRESRGSAITKRFSGIMDHLQGNIFIASQRINDLSGYSGIEALKSRIAAMENHVHESSEKVRTARTAFKTTVADRAATQKEVTTLLARKDGWTPLDLERFTSLYRMDHTNEQAVQEATTRLADAEREVEQAASNLRSSMLNRYHEEQIWSDKMRWLSTWGTMGLMGVNILLLFGFEPWRRARLVHGFEEKVLNAIDKAQFLYSVRNSEGETEMSLDGIVAAGALDPRAEKIEQSSKPPIESAVVTIELDGKPINFSPSTAATEIPTRSPLFYVKKPTTWAPAFQDLFSQRKISVRKQDVTLVALQGVATGAAIMTIIATLILRQR